MAKIDVSDIYEQFEQFINKELKNKIISNRIDYTIWYDIKKDRIFEVVEASSNWSFQEADNFICLLHLSEGANFTDTFYVREQINALGYKEWYSIYKEELNTVVLEKEDDPCSIVEKLISALSPEAKEDILELMFEQDRDEWIRDQFDSSFIIYQEQQELSNPPL